MRGTVKLDLLAALAIVALATGLVLTLHLGNGSGTFFSLGNDAGGLMPWVLTLMAGSVSIVILVILMIAGMGLFLAGPAGRDLRSKVRFGRLALLTLGLAFAVVGGNALYYAVFIGSSVEAAK